jgi:hypothetical protein
VTYRISDNLTDQKLIAAIDAAFAAWSSVPCSKLKFTKGQPFKACFAKPCATGTVDIDHAQPYLYLFWFTESSEIFKEPKDPKTVYSVYSFLWQNNVGGIVGATIAVNAKDFTFLPDASSGCSGTKFDMHDYLMPAIGGVSGLTDSNVASAVMAPGLKFCSTAKRALAQDDKDALVFLYPETTACKAPKPDITTGCSAGSAPTGDGGKKDIGGTTPAKEGGPVTPGRDGGVQPSVDGGGLPPKEGESGCCRVSHAAGETGSLVVVLVAGLTALGLLRRRRRV